MVSNRTNWTVMSPKGISARELGENSIMGEFQRWVNSRVKEKGAA